MNNSATRGAARWVTLLGVAIAFCVLLASCGGGGSPDPPSRDESEGSSGGDPNADFANNLQNQVNQTKDVVSGKASEKEKQAFEQRVNQQQGIEGGMEAQQKASNANQKSRAQQQQSNQVHQKLRDADCAKNNPSSGCSRP